MSVGILWSVYAFKEEEIPEGDTETWESLGNMYTRWFDLKYNGSIKRVLASNPKH